MKRRVRTLHPGYLVGTKGHSVLKKRTYTTARKPSFDVEDIVIQRMPISRKTVVDYSYPESVYGHGHASAYSNAVVDDCYDLHSHSRGRDNHLLSKMNNALLSTQPHLRSPKAIVAARRVTHLPAYKEVDLSSPAYYVSPHLRYVRGYNKRFFTTPYKSNPYVKFSNWGDYFDDEDLYSLPSKLRYHPAGLDTYSAMHPLHYHYLRHHLPDWRYPVKRRIYDYAPRRHYRRYYPTHPMALKALLVGEDKLEDPGHPRRVRRRYYPERPVHRDLQENLAMWGVPDTSGLKASRPPAPSAVPTHSWRAIREVEGYAKPHSAPWEYRLDSHVAPELQIPKTTSSYVDMRDQVRGVQDRMDRHRQLLDRYSDRPGMEGLDSHPSGIGQTGGRSQTEDLAAGGDVLGPVSPLRKKIRKVICKSRHDPNYFDEY